MFASRGRRLLYFGGTTGISAGFELWRMLNSEDDSVMDNEKEMRESFLKRPDYRHGIKNKIER